MILNQTIKVVDIKVKVVDIKAAVDMVDIKAVATMHTKVCFASLGQAAYQLYIAGQQVHFCFKAAQRTKSMKISFLCFILSRSTPHPHKSLQTSLVSVALVVFALAYAWS